MAQATTDQINALEKAHKQQLKDLIVGWQIFHNMAAPVTSVQINARSQFALKLLGLTTNWLRRNLDFENNAKIPRSIFTLPGILPSFADKQRFFNTIKPAAAYYIYNQKTNDNTQSIGFLPLLIWAVIALIAYFTVDTVVTNTNNTAADKTELVNATDKFCKDNKLTPEQCATLLQTSIPNSNGSGSGSDTGFFGSIKKILLWGAAAYIGIKFIAPEVKKQTQKTPANG